MQLVNSTTLQTLSPSKPFNPRCTGEWCATRGKFSVNIFWVRHALCSYHCWPQTEHNNPHNARKKNRKRAQIPKNGSIGSVCMHCPHSMIWDRCSVMLAKGPASTAKGHCCQKLLAQMSSQTVGSTLDAGLCTSFPAVRTRTPRFSPIVPITQNAQKCLGV